jgi:hypothetical protein
MQRKTIFRRPRFYITGRSLRSLQGDPHMRPHAVLGMAAAMLFSAGTLHAADVKTDYDHSVNFSQFHTYSWGQVKTDCGQCEEPAGAGDHV